MNKRPKNHKASADALRRERDELREAVRVLGKEVRRLHRIAYDNLHSDQSCSLEAQGYGPEETADIAGRDGMAKQMVQPNPPRGTLNPIGIVLANPIARKAVEGA